MSAKKRFLKIEPEWQEIVTFGKSTLLIVELEVELSFEIWSRGFLTLLGGNGNFEKPDTSHEVGK